MSSDNAKHGECSGVVDVARNGVDEVIRLYRQCNDLALLVRRLLRRVAVARSGAGSETGDKQIAREAIDYLWNAKDCAEAPCVTCTTSR